MPQEAFGTLDYWNEEFEAGEFAEPFDWLASWEDLEVAVTALVPCKDARVLIPGCGNAPFQLDMHQAGYSQMVCGDYSEVVIQQMRASQATQAGAIQWDVMDVARMPYENDAFDAVIDKSLMDCLRCCEDATNIISRYLDEAFRVLAPGGVFIAVSMHTEGSLRAVLHGRGWKVAKMERIILANGKAEPVECHDSVADLSGSADDSPDDLSGTTSTVATAEDHEDSSDDQHHRRSPAVVASEASCSVGFGIVPKQRKVVVTMCVCVKQEEGCPVECSDSAAKRRSMLAKRSKRNERRKVKKAEAGFEQANQDKIG